MNTSISAGADNNGPMSCGAQVNDAERLVERDADFGAEHNFVAAHRLRSAGCLQVLCL